MAEKKGYQPSEEEIKKAESMMTPEQKAMSKRHEQRYYEIGGAKYYLEKAEKVIAYLQKELESAREGSSVISRGTVYIAAPLARGASDQQIDVYFREKEYFINQALEAMADRKKALEKELEESSQAEDK